METFWPYIGTYVTIVCFVFTILKGNMKQESSRKKYSQWLEEHIFRNTYRNLLRAGLDFLGNIFGKPWGGQALSVSIALSFCYTLGVFFLVWLAGGQGKLGPSVILPEDWPLLARGILCLTFILFILLIFYHENINKKFVAFHIERFEVSAKLINRIYIGIGTIIFLIILFLLRSNIEVGRFTFLIIFLPVIIFSLSIVLEIVGIGIGIGIGIGVIVGGGLGGLGGLVIGAGFVIGGTLILAATAGIGIREGGALIVSVIGIGIGVIGFGLWSEIFELITLNNGNVAIRFSNDSLADLFGVLILNYAIVSFLLFLLILPMMNGMLDYISWAISRFLGEQILRHQSFSRIVMHVLLDMVVAILLLLVLTFLLTFGLEVINRFVLEPLQIPIDISGMMEQTMQSPLGQDGLWISFMLFSTLIPTMLHFGVALSSLSTLYFTTKNYRKRLIEVLKEDVLAKLDVPCLYFAFYFTNSITAVLGMAYLIATGVGAVATPVSQLLFEFGQWSLDLARQ